MHTRMVEQAAHDRNLFQSSPGTRTVDLRFPEYVSPTDAIRLGTVTTGTGWADPLRVFDLGCSTLDHHSTSQQDILRI